MKLETKTVLQRLRYFCSDAWDEWRHSKGVNLLALSTLVAALFVAGLVMLILSNIEHHVEELRDDVRVAVYLQDDLTDGDREALIAELGTFSGVERVEFVDREEALARYREWAAELAELVNELETNPLPASLEVYLAPGGESRSTATAIAAALNGRAGIEEVSFNQEWLARLESLLGLARVGGTGLAVLIFIAVVVVVASVLRLAVYSRRDEIEIMRLVGATPGFIRGPFLVAGAAQGLVASVLALVLVEALRIGTLTYAGSGALVLVELIGSSPLAIRLAATLLLLGMSVSLAGSYLSVRGQPE